MPRHRLTHAPVLALAMACLAAAPLGAQGPRPALDTTVSVNGDAQLRVELSSGRIDVRGWDRNAIRVVASHRPGTRVYMQASASGVYVWATGEKGRFDQVDYEITVPRRASLALGSGDVDITVVGTEGGIVARNHAGAITVDGGRGVVALKSATGEVAVANARGRISAQSMDGAVRMTDVSGEVEAQSTGMHLYLTRVDATVLEARTVSGSIHFSGPIHPSGRYAFTTHGGSIAATLAEPLHATVSVATVRGTFASDFPYVVRERRRAGIFTAVVGTGAATLDLESFAGAINIKRAGTEPPKAKPKPPE